MIISIILAIFPQVTAPPEPVRIRDITVSAQPAEPGFVDVQVRAYVESPRSIPDAKIQFRALQMTGLLTQEREVSITLESNKATPISVNLKLPDVDHKVEVILFEGGRMGERSSFMITGLTELEPLKPIKVVKADASLISVAGNRAKTELIVRLENTAREAFTDLQMELGAKDRATSLVIDRSTAEIGTFGPRETISISGQVELVVGRDYDIEITILRNRTIIGEGKAEVSLSLAEEVVPGVPTAQIQITIPTPTPAPTPKISIEELVLRPTPTPAPPGFESLLAIIALLLIWLYWRKNG
jgi:hypothetical protein